MIHKVTRSLKKGESGTWGPARTTAFKLAIQCSGTLHFLHTYWMPNSSTVFFSFDMGDDNAQHWKLHLNPANHKLPVQSW